MRYVILRDDDTNALTPVECLERLYRPFLDRGFPVNLAVIPEVRTDEVLPDGAREGYLPARDGAAEFVPMRDNGGLVAYLRSNPGYGIVQHGCHHDRFELDRQDREEIVRRLERGRRCLIEAGFSGPRTLVAPHDRLSRVGLKAAAERFRVVSTGWFELRRLPVAWWPRYVLRKALKRPHWRAGGAVLLSHPGCLLSCHRSCDTMLEGVQRVVARQRLTVLVTHWWEYFRGGRPDERFIRVLHRMAEWLEAASGIRVIAFDDLVSGRVSLDCLR